MRKRLLSALLALCMVLTLLPSATFAANDHHPFTDVSDTAWYGSAVQYVYEHDMMVGTSSTEFSPDISTSRGMIVTILHRLEGTPSASGIAFADVPADEWYTDAVAWASANEIVKGYGNGNFGPEDPISREQMATILYRYADYKGYDTDITGSVTTFPDGGQTNSWAVNAMNWAIGVGLISGTDNGTLIPGGSATRAQAATILVRFCENIVTHTVTFEYNYGNKGTYDTVTVGHGKTADSPTSPTRSGYTFDGWYTAASGGSKYNFSTAVTSDLTLYAHWTSASGGGGYVPNTYTVTFDSNGGSAVASQTVISGSCATRPTDPTKSGYIFVGWYTDSAYNILYDFDAIVTKSIVLYAKWREIDEEFVDNDDDGIPDNIEEFLGTDPTKSDTDGDGLSDYIEVLIGTDPTLIDTDGNGINDGDEDADGDNLTNLEELDFGTSLIDRDSDHDGLSDYEELYIYNTDPLNMDTDRDGAYDGWEIMHNYDPLAYNNSFTVSDTAQDEDISVSVVMETLGENVSSLLVEPVENMFLDDGIPGYIGSAFDFNIGGDFEQATISFTFDASLSVDEDFNPVIYYFNEDTQTLEELNTIVEGNTASTVVTHFSTYILLNKTDFDLVWESEIKPPNTENEDAVLDIVFVIDYSASMDDNDPRQLCKSLSKEFISKLRDDIDRAAVVKFIRRATVVSALTTDKDVLYNAIDSITYDSGYGTYSGTDGSTGLNAALELLESSESTYKYIIFLTDGEDNQYTYSYDQLIQTANELGVSVYTVGMGTATTGTLQKIASETGGKFYFAFTADALEDIYNEVAVETVDYSVDSNNDGISDYFTRLLCDGTLKLGSGKDNPFYGISYDEVQANADYDHDGLLNGQELVVQVYESVNGARVYVWMMSDPTSADSDYDGIDDCDEISQVASHSNQFTADVKYSTGGNSYDTTVSFRVDYSLFFEDNTVFNQDLSILASLYALDMYDDGWLNLTSGAAGSSESINGVSLGEIFGLNDGKNYSASDLRTLYSTRDSNGNYVDEDDVSEVYIGHRLVSYQGEQREIFFLTVRGTNGTNAEWSSNFDIGADDSSYYDKTGEHPDWTNKENHKGFDVAATRILRAFSEYVNELETLGKIDVSVKRSIFITGHSRGAAIANILGAHFEDSPQYDSYVYTMATPYTTTNSNATTYKTIFNIVNEDDLVPYLPLEDWDFFKYGETLTISVADKYEDRNPFGNAANTFEAAFGKDYNSNGWLDAAVTDFGKMSNGRSDFYVLDTTSGDGTVTDWEMFTDIEALLKDGKLDKYCTYEIGFAGLSADITYCPAYAAQNIANLAGSIPGYDIFDWLGVDLKGKYSTARRTFALASGKIQIAGIGPGGMECPHMPGTYYLITVNTSYNGYEK